MDRNTLLVKRIIMGLLSSFILGLNGCFFEQSPQKEYFIGEWESQYNEVLILNEDSSFYMKNLRSEILFRDASQEKINGEGIWYIDKKSKRKIHLRYLNYTINDIDTKKGYDTNFYVSGSGFLGNQPPWKIHSWDEDFDNYSIFQKMK
jgi:hypothetical protein